VFAWSVGYLGAGCLAAVPTERSGRKFARHPPEPRQNDYDTDAPCWQDGNVSKTAQPQMIIRHPIEVKENQMISLLITLLIICLIFSVVWWIIGMIPVPQPFANIIKVVLALILLIWLIYALLPLAGGGFGHPVLR
jgi:hypothetical protein